MGAVKRGRRLEGNEENVVPRVYKNLCKTEKFSRLNSNKQLRQTNGSKFWAENW